MGSVEVEAEDEDGGTGAGVGVRVAQNDDVISELMKASIIDALSSFDQRFIVVGSR